MPRFTQVLPQLLSKEKLLAQVLRGLEADLIQKTQLRAPDAVTDEKKGSYYPATLTLSQRDMLVDGKRVPLSAGMNVTAEIKTGERMSIQFLRSQMQRASLRGR